MAEQAVRLSRDVSRDSCPRNLIRRCVAGFGLLAALWAPAAARAQHCFPGDTPYGLIEFDPQPGEIVKPDSCNLLPCHQPEKNGEPYLRLVDAKCNPHQGSCAVQIRVPLKFPGNLQMPNNTHSHIYWFRAATPPSGNCLPPELGGNCNPITVCGLPGNEILADYGEAFLQVSASCADLASGTVPGLGTYSLSAYSCQDFTGECLKKLDVPNLNVTREMLAGLLLCDLPKCESCGACTVAGGDEGPGDGDGTGPWAVLRYRAGGAGHPGWPGSAAWRTTLGRYWSHHYAQRIVFRGSDTSRVWLITRHATFREFIDAGGDGFYELRSPSDEYRSLRRTAAGWELADLDGTVHSFDAAGLWTRTADPNGNRKVATYAAGILTRVDMPDGRHEVFTYHPGGKLAAIDEVGADGTTSRRWRYTWSGDDLARIDRPDGTAWVFAYGDPALPGYMTRMTLVGTDGGARIAGAWEYDGRGNRVRSWKGDASPSGPDAVEVTSYRPDDPFRPEVVEVTDALGVVSTYTLGRDTRSNKPRLAQLAGECPTCGAGPDTQLFYEDPAHPLLKTREIDAKGTVTLYTYDANGRMTSRTEASGTPFERTTTWEYQGPFPALVTATEQPSTSGAGSRRSRYAYDASGNLLTETIDGAEAGSAFQLTTTNRHNAAGQLEESNPPGYGTDDATRFTYDPARGNLVPLTRTDPLVGTTTYGYDAWNRRVSLTDPNGVRTITAYDPLNRITQEVEEGATPAESLVTRHEYNVFGDLARTILPRGNVIEYGYDAAGRLVSIEKKPDPATPGERTVFVFDGHGNRTREELQRWNGSAWVTDSFSSYVYSSRCHLDKVVHPDGSATEYGYDCNGNLEQIWDPNHPSNNRTSQATTTYEYDPLNRVAVVSQPWKGAGGGRAATRYEYDAQDHPVRVTDAEGNVTRYTYSDRDLMTRQESETAGATDYRYNEHGELVTETDARGIAVTRTLDAADRLTFADYPENALDTRFTYEDPLVPFSKGRLTAIIRNGGTVAYRYDRFGRILQDGALTYAYDANGNRREIGYPGGLTATYGFDFADREERVVLNEPGQGPKTLASDARYLAGGPLASLVLGNGLAETRTYSPRYFPDRIEVPGRLDWQYTTDAVGNVLAIQDALDPLRPRAYAYQDVAYFLTQGNGPWGNLSWTYDKIGNRLTQIRNGATETFSYARNAAGGNSSRLSAVVPAAGAATSFHYDAAGHQTHRSAGASKLRFTYSAERQLSQVSADVQGRPPAATAIAYDGRGLLLTSLYSLEPGTDPRVKTWATYGSDRVLYHRLSALRPAVSTPREQSIEDADAYVFYLDGRPVALLHAVASIGEDGLRTESRLLLYLTGDHLGTPALATDGSGNSVWAGGFSPFGEDWAGAQEAGVFLRLPGQWEDPSWEREAGAGRLHYNVHRWYEPAAGRYTQADRLIPVSSQEPNLFAYVTANPLVRKDPWGLFQIHDSCDCRGPGNTPNIPKTIALACKYRKRPGCRKLMDAHSLLPIDFRGRRKEKLSDCFDRRCSPEEVGKGPLIACNPDTQQCGWTPPSGDIVLYKGNDGCPRIQRGPGDFSGSRDYSQTLFHEIGHTCGVGPEEPDWWQEIEKVCTGWPL